MGADAGEATASVPAAVPGAGEGAQAAPAGAAAGAEGPTRAELALQLEEERSRADQQLDALLRTRAEMENLRKRVERDVENAHKFGLEKIAVDLLPVRDSLELGAAAGAEAGVDPAKVREGLELTLRMLSNLFEKFGIQEIDPQGLRFDPERHQAMTVQEGTGAEPGTVVMVVQKGYVLNGRLIRPAMVIVAR